MKPKVYEQNVLITESCDFQAIHSRLDDRAIRLLHAGLGLSSELTELVDAYLDPPNGEIDWINVSEETGDLTWYCGVAVNTLGFDHNEISCFESVPLEESTVILHSTKDFSNILLSAVYFVGEYNDFLKKHLFYGRELDQDKIKQNMQQICACVSGLCVVSGTTIEKAREINIEKLKARFGDKFTAHAALNRNLEEERNILEGTNESN